jgi:hypothetical protein
VNLRLYHTSPRLSEGINFDARVVGRRYSQEECQQGAGSRPLLTELASVGITLSEIKPRQADAGRATMEIPCHLRGETPADALGIPMAEKPWSDLPAALPPSSS